METSKMEKILEHYFMVSQLFNSELIQFLQRLNTMVQEIVTNKFQFYESL